MQKKEKNIERELRELENELWLLEGNVITSSDIERLLKIVKLDK